jgi:hypothetical protein
VSLVPVPSEHGTATCAHCGAALVADQRYCLSCGRPASPVRLAFLDVLHGEPTAASSGIAQTIETGPAGYVPAGERPHGEPRGVNGRLRRHSGVLSLLAVLALCLIAGLLLGHWAGQAGTKVPAKQVVEVKGLSGLAAAPPAAASTTPASTTSTPAAVESSKTSAKEEAQAAKERAKETKAEKAPPPKPVKVAPAKIKKLSTSSGKQHQEEINALGAQPIETG